MTDYHVHIGQFENVYYYADRVFSALKSAGVDEAWFSSTTSCIFCKESEAARSNVEIARNAPSARELYSAVRDEVKDALRAASEIGLKAHALYWVVPEVHFAGAAMVESAMAEKVDDSNFLYEGFKIHTRAQNWDLSDGATAKLAEEIFSYAEKHGSRIVIHSGEDAETLPTHFEPFIAQHPSVTVQLAHLRPIKETLYMLAAYSSVVCDCAMASKEAADKIASAGFGGRLLYGSDFPITHYQKAHPDHDPSEKELTEFLL